jgi:hypothetical protein
VARGRKGPWAQGTCAGQCGLLENHVMPVLVRSGVKSTLAPESDHQPSICREPVQGPRFQESFQYFAQEP